ncbi:MAG: DNA polymerase I [Clostridiales bacterium]|nr:DNA polymerase I [Clostridiales bacterium]
MEGKHRLVIIDGNSLLNRAYYAMQKPMMTKEGLYTHGVYGFLNMLAKIQKDYEHEYIAVAFDRKAPTFRHIEYAEYKAGRKKMPPELAMQMPLLKEVLSAMDIKMLEIDGFEADDIIGTVAKKAERAGLSPLVITGDKDELQLASEMTSVIITKKGITDFELYDKAAMIEKYGFTPQQFIDYKGLMGDQSDNIPGIPGVGEKTAQKLIIEHGSVEALVEAPDKIPNEKLRNKIIENSQLALMSKRLATINTDVPIPFELEELKVATPDFSKLIDVYVKLEFNSFLKKMNTSETGAAKLKSRAVKTAYSITGRTTVQSKGELDMLVQSVSDSGSLILKVYSDRNHRDVPEILGVGVLAGENCFFLSGEETGLLHEFFAALAEIAPQITGHNLISDYYALLASGYAGCLNTCFDTEVAQYVIEPGKSNYELKTLMLEYFSEDIEDEKAFLSSNAQVDLFSAADPGYLEYTEIWCTSVSALKNAMIEKIASEGLCDVYYKVELPLIGVLADMEMHGFTVDKKILEDAGEEISKQLDRLSSGIIEHAGEEFNINSTQQLGRILFEKLGLPTGKKLKTGYSTNVEVLEKLAGKHPIIELILEYRLLAKLKGTYIDGLLPLIHKDGKIHAHFRQTVTATGRISCTEPNLQNIPTRREEGRKIRKAFVAGEGRCLVGADYSQIELRVLAHMSGDPELVQAFNDGVDIHRLTASRVLGIPEGEVTAAQRSDAKAVNFGVIYGMSGFGLSSELHITRKEAEMYIDEYFKKYTLVKQFMDEQVLAAKQDGHVKTIMGRKRAILEISAANYTVRQLGERLAMNSPIQGSAADIIKIAMINVHKALADAGLKSKLILQVHDELIIEAAEEETETVKELLAENMEKAMNLMVKLSVGISSGKSWYELK